jgi:hypothetical protein
MIWADRVAIGFYLIVIALIGVPWFGLIQLGMLNDQFDNFWHLCEWFGLVVGLPIWAVLRITDWIVTGRIRIDD